MMASAVAIFICISVADTACIAANAIKTTIGMRANKERPILGDLASCIMVKPLFVRVHRIRFSWYWQDYISWLYGVACLSAQPMQCELSGSDRINMVEAGRQHCQVYSLTILWHAQIGVPLKETFTPPLKVSFSDFASSSKVLPGKYHLLPFIEGKFNILILLE